MNSQVLAIDADSFVSVEQTALRGRIGTRALSLNPLRGTKWNWIRPIADVSGHATVRKVQVDRAGRPGFGRVDDGLAGAIGNPHKSALERSLGMSQLGKPPQG